MASSNLTNLPVGKNFNTTVKIMIDHKLSLATKFQLHTLFRYQDIGMSCFHCLQNDDVIKFGRFWQLIRISVS